MSVCVSVKLYYSKILFFRLTIQDNKQLSYLDQISQYMMKSGLALCVCTLQHIKKKTFTIALQRDAPLDHAFVSNTGKHQIYKSKQSLPNEYT